MPRRRWEWSATLGVQARPSPALASNLREAGRLTITPLRPLYLVPPQVESTGRLETLIWDETQNPARNHKYWAARALISGLSGEFRRVAVGSCGNYGLSVTHAALERGLEPVIFVPRNTPRTVTLALRGLSATVYSAGETYEDAVRISKSWSQSHPYTADANVDGPHSELLLEAIAARIHLMVWSRRLTGTVNLWVPTGNGTTLAGFWRAISREGWSIRLCAVSSRGNNSIARSLQLGREHLALDRHSLHENAVNVPLCNWNALHGDLAVRAVLATGGSATEVADRDLIAASRDLGQVGLDATPSGAAGLAGLRHNRSNLAGCDIILVTGGSLT